VDVIAQERAHSLANVRAHAAAGTQPWATFWPESDGEARAAADEAWLAEHRAALLAAVGGDD
jgi:hypothetical protein